MSSRGEPAPHAGDLVDLYDEGDLVSAVVLGEEKGRLRAITESGRELRIAPSRIAHRAGDAPVAPPRAAAAAASHARAAEGRVPEIDLPSLWDVLVDSPQRHPLGELAALALGEDSGVARSAMLRALHRDRIYFSRKAEDFEPRARERVEETRRRDAAELARAHRRAAFVGVAREALAGRRPDPPLDARSAQVREPVADLVELALMGEQAESRREALSLLDEAGAPDGGPAERAFRLLAALGIFHEDENLFIHRFHLKTSFPPEVEQAAARAAGSLPSGEGRIDLTHLEAFTVDDDRTTEMDDALTLEQREGRLRLGVHIADPGCFVEPGDAVDREAMARAATWYFPEVRLPMLPACLSERAASLVPGEARPALSFLATLSPPGELIDSEIVPSVIRSRARLTYEQADAALQGGGLEGPDRSGTLEPVAEALRLLRPVTEALEAERVARGAVVLRAPELLLRVDPVAGILIRRVDERGVARRLVAEAMILANRLAAELCARRGIPIIYRRQPPPAGETAAAAPGPSAGPPDAGYDPVAVRALRRRMRRGEVGLVPGPHHGLGLQAYTQATSPIRRYQDLVVHRQIKAALAGRAFPYGTEDLSRIAATTEEAERSAREAERGATEYWLLRHYEALRGAQLEGIIVACDARRTEVELVDTLYTAAIPPRPDHAPGRRLRLVVEASRPRAGRLTLRELAG